MRRRKRRKRWERKGKVTLKKTFILRIKLEKDVTTWVLEKEKKKKTTEGKMIVNERDLIEIRRSRGRKGGARRKMKKRKNKVMTSIYKRKSTT